MKPGLRTHLDQPDTERRIARKRVCDVGWRFVIHVVYKQPQRPLDCREAAARTVLPPKQTCQVLIDNRSALKSLNCGEHCVEHATMLE